MPFSKNPNPEEVYDAIVVGAGVIGPAIATGLARKGKKVLVIERDWSMPDRIVGELMQPGGLRALRQLGMIQAINNIDAYPVTGYTIFYEGQQVDIPYPTKDEVAALEFDPELVKDGNNIVLDDATIKKADFEDDERLRGAAFVHGRFVNNLRKFVEAEPNVTIIEGNVIEILKNDVNEVVGAKVSLKDSDKKVELKAHLTIISDGIFSKYRKELSPDHVPFVGSSFIGMSLEHANMPHKNHGHVILGKEHSPVIVYQISPEETRILCAYNSAKLPADIKTWLQTKVEPNLPKELVPSFKNAVAEGKYRTMPNSYLSARQNNIMGCCVIGDALNIRHPLTGGGMTVGLNDVVLLLKKIGNLDFADRERVVDELLDFHYERKYFDSVINTLSIALYSLFAADDKNLKILQKGCFAYFQQGGECLNTPIKFLSGVLPAPLQLTRVFFAVALYSIWVNFQERGLAGFPLALLEMITVLITAVRVFTPFLYTELIG